jgi:release factor glutamine methyltransferase
MRWSSTSEPSSSPVADNVEACAARVGGAGAAGEGVGWRELHAEAIARLGAAGVTSPEAEARWIVEAASGNEGAEFVDGLDQLATIGGVTRFDRMVARRVEGEPLQYVLGRWAFRTLDLMVDRRVLIPRPETEVVAGVALDELARQAGAGELLHAVDLGSGSGAIGLSLVAERDDVAVVLTDVSADALDVARSNLAGLGRPATRVTIAAPGSWFDPVAIDLRGRLHLVVSNPPYVADDDDVEPVVRQWEPAGALFGGGPTGAAALEAIIDAALEWLAPGGALVLELAPMQAAAMAARGVAAGYEEVRVVQDLSGRDRVLAARRPPARKTVGGAHS